MKKYFMFLIIIAYSCSSSVFSMKRSTTPTHLRQSDEAFLEGTSPAIDENKESFSEEKFRKDYEAVDQRLIYRFLMEQ